MKTMRHAIRWAVCAGCLASVQPALSDEVQPGFYFGLSGGQASYDLEKSDMDGIVFDALLSQDLFPISGASSFEDSDTSLALFAGYHFNQYIAVEAAYIDLGAAEYRWSGRVNPFGSNVSLPSVLNIDVASTGFTIAGLGSLPLGNVFDLHGRLGILFAQTDLDITVGLDTVRDSQTETLDSINGFFSVGAGLNFANHWSLSLDWTRYDNVSDEDNDDDVRTEAGFNIDNISLSAKFRF